MSRTPQVQQAMSVRVAAACERAGGQQIVAGAAAAGAAGGLCLGALLFSGDSAAAQKRLADAISAAQQRNRTVAIRSKLRRGLRKRLLLLSATSAAGVAYLCTLPTPLEGGAGLVAHGSAIARRLGRAADAAGRTLVEEPPPSQRQRRRWHV
ncbi:unnamed protein product [Effrenium voratum]|uniref:Transmembrane protein n=1 Tax=Effrenium voratum TaxID=2562239 RepID=A0AA36MW40_9DINO|nr:unnamed protein product [Effrenium voratum]CAJ1381003.1 unnamed protein product [Effrenium voratum]CAJ1437417.1 unnamed protein product [Effrenium voratum]